MLGRRLIVDFVPGLQRATALELSQSRLWLLLGELREDQQTQDCSAKLFGDGERAGLEFEIGVGRLAVDRYRVIKDLICDWRWGERAFMELEVDGDLAATQATKYDADGEYIRRWVPELRHVNTKDLLTGEIGGLERRGYPEPLINHKVQQALFKSLYATIRS